MKKRSANSLQRSAKKKAKAKKILPFAWIDRKWSIFSKRSRQDFDALERGLRALVKRFGYQRVLRDFVHLASTEGLRGFRTSEGHLYREAHTLLDHAEKTLSTIARLERELAQRKLTDLTDAAPRRTAAPRRAASRGGS